MKKVILSLMVGGAFFANALNADELTGDTKLACEAILCLSSGTRPSECNPSIKKYFSIKAKRWKDTINARRNFLKLCPTDSDDKEFANLRDNVIPNITEPCDEEYLNSRIESSEKAEYNCYWDGDSDVCEYGYRIATDLPQSCKILAKSSYTNIKPKYVCSGNFIASSDWRNGYTLIKISQAEYEKLKAENPNSVVANLPKGIRTKSSYNSIFASFYKKEPINKRCWVIE